MKRLLVLVLLVPILALTMISCEGDMISNITGFMDSMGGNFYEDSGFITINTGNADDAIDAISEIGSAAGIDEVSGTETSSMGVSVTVASGTKLLAPQLKPKQDEVKNKIDKALGGSPAQIKVFLDDLKGDITPEQKTAASGTITVFNKTLEELGKKLNSDISEAGSKALGEALEKLTLPPIGDNPTKGDLLALQLMTDLIYNTVQTLNEIGGGVAGDGGAGLAGVTSANLEANKDKVLSIVNDALFAAQIAEQISGAASIDFTGLTNIGSLFGDSGDKGTRSRGEPIALTDAADFIPTINSLGPKIVELMGITYNGTNFVYDDVKYENFLFNQKFYRSSMEQALNMMELGKLPEADKKALNLNLGTLVKYALSVFITDHDAFWKAKSTDGAPKPNAIIALYLNDSAGDNKKLGLGTLTKDDELTQPTGITGFRYDDWPGFLKLQTKAYYEAILTHIITINDAAGITAELSTELEKFRDAASTEDGLTKWYNELL